MEVGSEIAFLADRFRIDRRKIRQVFVDETLVKIDGLEYWLWIAYEPNLDVCLMMHLSREKTELHGKHWKVKDVRLGLL